MIGKAIGLLTTMMAGIMLTVVLLLTGVARQTVSAEADWSIRLATENGTAYTLVDPHSSAAEPVFTPDDLPGDANITRQASLSPDGRWLMTEERYNNLAFNEFYLHDLTTGDRRKVFDGEFFDVTFHWSDDSRYAAYALGTRRTSLWVLDTQTQTEQFVMNLTDVSHVSWSPDTTRLALQYQQGVAVIDRTGRIEHRIANRPDLVGRPNWVGGHILYYACSTAERPLIRICAADLRHGLTVTLLDLAPALPDGGFIRQMHVNPQGQVVLKLDGLIASGELFSYDPATDRLTNLTADHDLRGADPRWQASAP